MKVLVLRGADRFDVGRRRQYCSASRDKYPHGLVDQGPGRESVSQLRHETLSIGQGFGILDRYGRWDDEQFPQLSRRIAERNSGWA